MGNYYLVPKVSVWEDEKVMEVFEPDSKNIKYQTSWMHLFTVLKEKKVEMRFFLKKSQ